MYIRYFIVKKKLFCVYAVLLLIKKKDIYLLRTLFHREILRRYFKILPKCFHFFHNKICTYVTLFLKLYIRYFIIKNYTYITLSLKVYICYFILKIIHTKILRHCVASGTSGPGSILSSCRS